MQISTRDEDYLIDVIELRSVISMHLLPAVYVIVLIYYMFSLLILVL